MDSDSILAVETSTVACSAALIVKGQIYQRYERLPQKHAIRLLEMVDDVMNEAGIKGSDIDVLAYGEGPGAFTGVRIATGVVQGLALGWNKPVIGVSSLEAMAERVLSQIAISSHKASNLVEVPWCALMDARMQEVYIQSGSFNVETRVWKASDVCLISPEEAKERLELLEPGCIGLGDIVAEYPSLTQLFSTWFDTLPSAMAVARLVQRMDLESELIYQSLALPVYLRNHVADTIQERLENCLKKQEA